MRVIPLISAVLIIGISSFAGIYLTKSLAGSKPTNKQEKIQADQSVHSVKIDKTLEQILPSSIQLQEQIKADPKNLELREKLVLLIKDQYQQSVKSGSVSKELSFYYLESLLEILKIDPQHKNALIGLADIAFEKQIFVKASEYYKAYLDLEPKDLSARARYASALTFANNFEQALLELDLILKENPKHFQALAYKTITLAQKGDSKAALLIAKTAMENAPSAEAKQRFAAYVKTLESESQQTFVALRSYLINNSVTSGKFVEIKVENKKLQIYLSNFPMNQMPEFAKAKFLGKIKELLVQEKKIIVDELNLIDFENNQVMHSEAIS
jgi:tetratricopeptide (TPR) repeat protein